ncbi:DUF2478 domain-containing protein [Paracoccus sp. Z118]|uniref:DUF2478 domain-containing protein n=1 Tax=Paracoccus sp. Z118 TaxID=2851017 RepID=UPI001C2C0FE6|nr:DUF2478 domain-containing protein [Paracoccus sp. Z118]MBV0890745.1 DUF2478 domain-containing protein [Paracoccus sp. Z118]
MLAYVTSADESGAASLLFADIARRLAAEGLRLAGAVQVNHDRGADCSCDMDLTVLGDGGPAVRISQSLGNGAGGCRLDSGALALAVGRAARVLEGGADLVIVNKFGRQEAEGGGFRELIAEALAQGTPVLIAVAPKFQAAFTDFAGDLAQPLAPEDALDWCRAAALHPAG